MGLAKRAETIPDVWSIEIGGRLWIVVPPRILDTVTAEQLCEVLATAVDRGALNVVVDLATVAEISPDAAEVLGSVSETLLAAGGHLWLANIGDVSAFPIQPVDERGLMGLVGLSPLLGAALRPARRLRRPEWP